MSALFTMLGILAGGGAAWYLVKSSEHLRYASRLRELESKFRYVQGETLTLKEQLITAKAQMAAAEKTLLDERTTHTALLSRVTESFKKGILVLTGAYFSVGLIFGGTAGWFGAGWKIGAGQAAERSQYEMDARLANLKAEFLQKQVDQLARSSDFFEQTLREERVAKAVAMTKLQILLDSVYPEKSGGRLQLDESRLRKNLKEKIEIDSPHSDLPILNSAPRP